MSNFTFGNSKYPGHDTIPGGSGEGGVTDTGGKSVGDFNGTSVVHAHTINSRLTNLEIFEFRFPVRLDQKPGLHQPGWHASG